MLITHFKILSLNKDREKRKEDKEKKKKSI